MPEQLHARVRAQLKLALLGDCGCPKTLTRLEREARSSGLTGAEIDAAIGGRSFEARTAAAVAFACALKAGKADLLDQASDILRHQIERRADTRRRGELDGAERMPRHWPAHWRPPWALPPGSLWLPVRRGGLHIGFVRWLFASMECPLCQVSSLKTLIELQSLVFFLPAAEETVHDMT